MVTRCVRRERLLDQGERKQWLWLCRSLGVWLRHMGIDLGAYSDHLLGGHMLLQGGHWVAICCCNSFHAGFYRRAESPYVSPTHAMPRRWCVEHVRGRQPGQAIFVLKLVIYR